MTDKDNSSKKSALLLTLVSALVIVVGLQAWYMADMKLQLDQLREQSDSQHATGTQNGEPPGPAQTPAQPYKPPAVKPPRQQPLTPFDDDWFSQPFDAQNWDPYGEIQRMQREMDQLFDEAFGRFNRSPNFRHLYRDRMLSPDIDLKEEGDSYIAMVDLPGIDEGDLSIMLENQVLTITGRQNATQQDADADGNTIFSERRSGTFRRSITLPEPVRESGMQTKLENGVLKITIPKAG